MQLLPDMRTPIFPALFAACALPACSDADRDDADIAADDGASLGRGHATNAEAELFVDDDPTAAGKAGAIMMALDDGELMLSDFALSVSDDPVILDFADEMFVVHANHMAEIADLLLDIGLAPIENETSIALAREAERNLRVLQTTADADYEYMRQQVVAHSEAFVLVTVLADIAPYAELEVFFADTLPVIEAHRAEAVEILRDL